MTFEEFLGKIKNIKCEEQRADMASYLERVFAAAEFQNVFAVLDEYFGGPFKPAGQKPSKEAENYASSYGGIMSNQTMYLKMTDNGPFLAMIWPWGSMQAMTLKIVQPKESP